VGAVQGPLWHDDHFGAFRVVLFEHSASFFKFSHPEAYFVYLRACGSQNVQTVSSVALPVGDATLHAFAVLDEGRSGPDEAGAVTKQALSKRREVLASTVKPHDHVDISQVSSQTAKEILSFVKSHGLEGIIAKRSDGVYEPGRRNGLWVKRRINSVRNA
jgi:hypothetical protein